jgi:hypothetical protein
MQILILILKNDQIVGKFVQKNVPPKLVVSLVIVNFEFPLYNGIEYL